MPRAGKKNIDVMVNDFLTAWLIEGDALAAMGYVSERSYACVSQDADDPSNFDLGLAPFQLLTNLKAAHDALGTHAVARWPARRRPAAGARDSRS